MDKKTYVYVATVIFLLIFIVHGLRVIYGWEGVIAGWQVPMWISWLAVIISGGMAWHGFKLAK